MTIEERANANMERMILGEYRQDECYILGATEQKAIDIEKACEWLKNNGYLATNGWYTITGTLDDFRKAMEE